MIPDIKDYYPWHRDVFYFGQQAHLDGLARFENPHLSVTWEGDDWDKGFLELETPYPLTHREWRDRLGLELS